jgi:hypothetical protein
MPSYVTEGASTWIEGWSNGIPAQFERIALRKGRGWLKRAGHATVNDDLALLAYFCWTEMSKLSHEGDLEDDYTVANDVLDTRVTDRDAELLCELLPLDPEEPIGGMSPHVTAIHTVLLDVVGAMRETWTEDDE